MSEDNEYFEWLAEGGRIRVGVRAIIFDGSRKRILLEKNVEVKNPFYYFVGGGIQVGETMLECIRREVREEIRAEVVQAKYLFVVENFFCYEGEIRHGLEHYFAVTLDREDLHSTNPALEYRWFPVDGLVEIDLRPLIVRDAIIDGSYALLRHLVSSV
jgi:8-oxo-dGTP pyrophosphatase MutT (NUDIX family)